LPYCEQNNEQGGKMLSGNTFTTIKKVGFKYCGVYIGFIFMLFGSVSYGQDSLSGEKGFKKAQQLAFHGKHPEARNLLSHLLKTDPGNADVQTLMGRTYTWDNLYDSARYWFNKVLAAHPANTDALNAMIDAELWSDHPAKALEYIDRGLQIDAKNEDFMMKKVRALDNLGHKEEALHLADSFAMAYGNNEMREKARQLRRAFFKSDIVFTSDIDLFSSTFSPWYYSSLSYGYKTKVLGTVIGRVNYARRFNENGYQLEADAYPSIGKKMYAYVNAGYSPSSIFPVARGGLSLYRNLPAAFEAELGARYLYFSSSTFIYTASVGKYYKNFWFSLRTFVTPGDGGTSASFYLSARYYLANADNYFTLRLGSGLSPDERAADVVFFSPSQKLLSSKNIKVDFQKEIFHDYYLGLRAAFSHDEINPGIFRENPSFGLSLEKRF